MSEELKSMTKEELIRLIRQNIEEDNRKISSKDTLFNHKKEIVTA